MLIIDASLAHGETRYMDGRPGGRTTDVVVKLSGTGRDLRGIDLDRPVRLVQDEETP